MQYPQTAAQVIGIKPTSSSQLLLQHSPTQWQLSKRLTVDVAVQNNFTIQLARLITKDAVTPEAITALDTRVLPEAFLGKQKLPRLLLWTLSLIFHS